MDQMMAYCGIMCDECPAYKATVDNNDELRKKTAVSGVKCLMRISGRSTSTALDAVPGCGSLTAACARSGPATWENSSATAEIVVLSAATKKISSWRMLKAPGRGWRPPAENNQGTALV